jgi:predicted phosphodiesterase
MTITRRWKRFLALGCSHGAYANPTALAAVLKFKAQYKPHFIAHLGDCFDMAAFRSGAKGSNDESEPLAPDVDAGLDFLRKLKPDVFLCGNHESRLWTLMEHHNAIVAGLAHSIVSDIKKTCKSLNCKVIPWDYQQAYKLGNYSLMHGFYFNEMACRDHAEAFGNVIFVHTHRVAIAKGRRSDSPTGINCGCLIDVKHAGYAKARRATLSWANGFAFGEYCDDKLVAYVHEQPQGVDEWRLPS